ncbi:MAG: SAM-dependent methyltransferase [Synergistetes bacterium]|nr:SAM-dependent methyltransferase [Synergistota bacterium]MDK2871444.1 hypothetical protein [bacterium]
MNKSLFDLLEGLPLPDYIKVQINNFRILAFQYAQLETIKQKRCIDEKGNPIPWYTYPALDFLKAFDFGKKVVFEYGGGSSTLWWAERAERVVTVEHDKSWYYKLKESASSFTNVEIALKEKEEEYVNYILEQSSAFDIVVVDGRWRGKCARVLGGKLNKASDEGYMVILDNSDWYPGISRYLREELDLIGVDFTGFGPINGYIWTTSVFLSRNFRFKFKESFSVSGGCRRDDDLYELF